VFLCIKYIESEEGQNESVLGDQGEHMMTQYLIFNFILLSLYILLSGRFTKNP